MLLTRLRDVILKNHFFVKGDRILVGVSGGIDSIVLLHALYQLSKEEEWELYAAHLNHQFRGEESIGDAVFVKEFCNQYDIPCEIGERDVPAFIREKHLNPQEASRLLRFSFLHEVSKKWNLKKLALAHHANDQAETVLMRIIRGTGIEGLAGIPIQREEEGLIIVRPFLSFYRRDIEEYASNAGITHRLDSSNFKTKYHRNFLRLKIIPWLEDQLGAGIQESLVHLSDVAAAENDLVKQITREKLKGIIKSTKDNKIVIKGKLFLECHLALQRRMIKLIFSYLLQKEESLGFIHINQVCDWILKGQTGTGLDMPHSISVWREYEDIVFSIHTKTMDSVNYSYPISIPGRTYIKELDAWIRADIQSAQDETQPSGYTAVFDLDHIEGELRVRSRQSGDRMTLFGMQGSKKVKDILIDAKVPRRARALTPIITDEKHILWIPGVKRSNIAVETSNTKQILTINIEEKLQI